MPSLGLTITIVAMGGALGAVSRFLLSGYFNRVFEIHHTVHIGTMLVNIIGSSVMGVAYVYVMVGMLGAFTTFSSFSLEAITFFERGHPWLSLAYVLGTVILCLTATTCAIWIARQFF
jgi:fluoride exporter